MLIIINMSSCTNSDTYDFNSDGIVIVKMYDCISYDINSINDKTHPPGFKIMSAAHYKARKISIDTFLYTIACDHVVFVDTTTLSYAQCRKVVEILNSAEANYICIIFSPQQLNIFVTLINQLPTSVRDVKIFQQRDHTDITTEYNDEFASAVSEYVKTSKIKSFTLQADSAEPHMLEIIIDAINVSDSIQTFTIITSRHLESLRRLCMRKSSKPFRLNIKYAVDALDDNTITCLENFKQLHTLDIRIVGRKFTESMLRVIRRNKNIRTLITETSNASPTDAIGPNITAVKCNKNHLIKILQLPHIKTIEVTDLYGIDDNINRGIMKALEANTTIRESQTLRHQNPHVDIILHRNNMIARENVTKTMIDLALIFVNTLPPYVLVEVFDWISPYYYTHVSLKFKAELVLRIYEMIGRISNQ